MISNELHLNPGFIWLCQQCRVEPETIQREAMEAIGPDPSKRTLGEISDTYAQVIRKHQTANNNPAQSHANHPASPDSCSTSGT